MTWLKQKVTSASIVSAPHFFSLGLGSARRARAGDRWPLAAHPSAIFTWTAFFTPRDCGVPLIRVGEARDGSYWIPDDVGGIVRNYSPGVGPTWIFESELDRLHGIPSTLCDPELARPEGLPDHWTFSQRALGPIDSESDWTLASWIDANGDTDGDLMLQMDIEGWEWRVLATASRSMLRRFRIIVVEFHIRDPRDWLRFGLEYVPAVSKLLRDFQVVHLHANNCCGVFEIDDLVLPRVLEVTLLRRDRVREDRGPALLPKPGEMQSVPGNEPIDLWTNWPHPPGR